jgi:glutaredoxin 3
MVKVEIWGKPQCPFCDRAKSLCEKLQLEYEYKQLGIDFDREQIMENFPGARTFPQIRISGKTIGGYQQLAEYIEQTNFNGTGLTL